jgi:tetratricopeptide (TPR) repeat protein
MKYLFFICLALLGNLCYACLNEEHITKSGKSSVDGFSLHDLQFYKTHDKATLELALKNLLSEKEVTPTDILATKNSIAVTLIKLGRFVEAEDILNELLKKYPENYSVTINLGTLYELQGKNAKALQFINKAVAINPDSHSGSEWFHIKILEYKLKNIDESNISTQNILTLYNIKKTPSEIAYEVGYQLQERIPFTPAPNILIAKVMQELGDYLADSISLSGAYVIYEIAMDYDRQNVLKLSKSRDALIPYLKKYGEKIPQTGIYYIDRIIPVDNGGKVKAAVTILEKGFDYFNNTEKKRKEEAERRKQYLVFGGIGLAITILGLFFYKKRN